MAVKKPSKQTADPKPAAPANEYDKILADYGQALEQLRQGKYAEAREALLRIASDHPEEPEVADRARLYLALCERKLAAAPAAPQSGEDLYYAGVLRANAGLLDQALELLSRAIETDSQSAKYLYARASAYALLQQPDSACADLRKAVAIDPTFRFQASNDPDFEQIRDDAAFIDVIEPTPAGA